MEKPKIETMVVKPPMTIFENEIEQRLISVESEMQLDESINFIEDFMKNNDGKNRTELEKDELYGEAKKLWNEYAEMLQNVKFTFYLNRKQYQYLTELLRDKLEYDVNSIFLAIELTDMLGNWHVSGSSKDDNVSKGYELDSTEITYVYHLISKHKVKGLTNSTYTFSQILKKIGLISKIINYYDSTAKSLSKDIQDWVAAFEEGVTVEGKAIKPTDEKE